MNTTHLNPAARRLLEYWRARRVRRGLDKARGGIVELRARVSRLTRRVEALERR